MSGKLKRDSKETTMCTFIELRCNRRNDNPDCHSNENDDPMELSGDSLEDIRETLKLIAQDARASGWKKLREGWVCPRCLSRPR